MEINLITESDVEDMIEKALSEDRNNYLWCEKNSLRMQIKEMQEQIDNLKKTVEQLKHKSEWVSGYDDHGWNTK